ncbi:Flp family type IVb pilin [Stenotrophomonas sp. 278]|uniref:Flp family type IVb pilin n=1 Tax=Stenotrophomonas sp. 278 TaxID=2479851 RepID=UPI000F65C671|nr:Flp family type IVb pilin [Stenotrophomonas sp. 278]RRU05296.1 Flp family type IVb pilin [Stenotrophomonas sp. 278]
MNVSIRSFLVEEDGVTALEYGLLAAVIAGVLVLAGREGLTEMFSTLFGKLKDLVESTIDGTGGGSTTT